jgi:two-component system chemotaxis response regulator CheB
MRGPKVHHQRPAVDVLFESAMNCGNAPRTLGIVMTGMGSGGARGLLSLKNAGAETIAQDESSCVVFGMPKEAIKLGAANRVLPLVTLPVFINQHAGTRASSSRLTGAATLQ